MVEKNDGETEAAWEGGHFGVLRRGRASTSLYSRRRGSSQQQHARGIPRSLVQAIIIRAPQNGGEGGFAEGEGWKQACLDQTAASAGRSEESGVVGIWPCRQLLFDEGQGPGGLGRQGHTAAWGGSCSGIVILFDDIFDISTGLSRVASCCVRVLTLVVSWQPVLECDGGGVARLKSKRGQRGLRAELVGGGTCFEQMKKSEVFIQSSASAPSPTDAADRLHSQQPLGETRPSLTSMGLDCHLGMLSREIDDAWLNWYPDSSVPA